jgi:hypothetical protein
MLLSQLRNMFPKTFNKGKLVEQIGRVSETINQHVLPNYRIAAELKAISSPKNKESKGFIKAVESIREVKGNYAEIVTTCLTKAVDVMQFASTYSEKIFANNEATMGLSYSKMTLLRVVQAADFSAKYARGLLNYICYLEASEKSKTEPPSKAMVSFLNKGLTDFVASLQMLNMDVREFEKHLKSLPDAAVTEKSENTFMATMGFAKFDPFNLRNLNVVWNPIYHIQMWRAESQYEAYEEAKEEAQLLQLRLTQLQNLQDGTEDAHVEKEINIVQDRLTGLQYKIHQKEEEYGL